MNLSFKKYSVAFALLVLLFSCSDKVDLKVPQTTTRMVFDGVVTDSVGSSYIKITQSIDFSSSAQFPVIKTAKVEVLEDESKSIPFVFNEATSSYLPVDPLFKGNYGKTYQMKAIINNQVYLSSVQPLPKKVPNFYEFGVFEDGEYPRYKTILEGPVLFYSLLDKERDGDYYRWQFWVNGLYKATGAEVFLNTDDLMPVGDSIVSNRPLSLDDPEVTEFKVVCRQSRINKDVAEFWDQYSNTGQSQGGPFDTTPDPPVSNVQNQNNLEEEVFGIFSAESFIKDSVMYIKK